MRKLDKKRRLENKTNYSKRRLLLEGKKPRIVIRKSNKYITLQYVESKEAQDTVKASAISSELTSYGWPKEAKGSLKSLGAAYLIGFLFGKRIAGMKPAIVDLGLIRSTKGARIYAAIKGIIEAGFKVPCSEEIMPSDEMIERNDKIDVSEIKSEIELEGKLKTKQTGGKQGK